MSQNPLEVLREVPLFASLAEADLRAFVPLVRERRFPKGSVILMQGDPGDALYVIATGQVKVVLIGEDGREVILSVLGAGSFFGEMALLDDEPRSAHVVAMEESTLLQLRREDFQARLRASPDVAIGLLRELSRRLRRADDTIGSLALRDVNGRIAHLLLELASEEGGDRITRRLTHATLAQMVGASRETVSRTLRALANAGVVRVSRREIVLVDREPLRRAAQHNL
ncbi:MAG TPA: Crp/Fnr family transcriptional regulator [Gemmatimonadales bacterium]